MQVFATRKATAGGIAIAPQLTPKYRHAVRIMKLSAILLFAFCMQLSARGLTQTVTINVKEAPLEKVIQAIEKQTGYVFFYSMELLKQAKKVTLTVNNLPLEKVLDEVFREQPLGYVIAGKNITIRVKEVKKNYEGSDLSTTQKIDVRGRVVNESGEPVQASISVRGTTKGTTTNQNGEFQLADVEEDAILVISGVGIEEKELKLNGLGQLIITVKISIKPLDEVQMVAYGTSTKRFNTGNVTTVKGSEIARQPANNPLLALQGRVPGLTIIQSTGVSGSSVNVRIQGRNNLNIAFTGSDPLIVIDGVPYPSQNLPTFQSGIGTSTILGSRATGEFQTAGSTLAYINPEDIESIDVLKDADATAIYGSRAANGAILITTKRGKAGDVKASFNFQTGIGQVGRKMKLLNAEQYLEMRREAKQNDNLSINSTDYDLNGTWDSTRSTDWQKELIGGKAKFTRVTATVSGGVTNTNYLIGGTYSRETTVFPGDFGNTQGSLHFNINSSTPNKRFQIQLTGNYLSSNNEIPGNDFTRYIFLSPVAPALYNEDGTLNWAPRANGNSSWENPLSYNYQIFENKANNFLGNGNLSYRILPGLDIKVNLGYNFLQTNQFLAALDPSIKPENRPTILRSATFSNNFIKSWIVEPQINYLKNINSSVLTALVGATFQENSKEGILTSGNGQSSDLLLRNLSAATTISSTLFNTKYRYSGFFGRLNYTLLNRYLVNFSGRRDGSSRFGPGNQIHNFAAVGVGWIFSQERFIKNKLSFLSFGKLRGSFGITGNDQISDYQYLSLYSSTINEIPYQSIRGLEFTGISNPYIQWEETKKLQLGIDLGFVRDRFLLSGTYYRNRSTNTLTQSSLPIITGATSFLDNFPGLIQNTGWEFVLRTENFNRSTFTWTTSLNLTIPKNKLVSFPGLEASASADLVVIGKPLNIVKTYSFNSINPQNGRFLFNAANGTTTANPSFNEDRISIISLDPSYYGGLQNDLSYKGFQLGFLLQFTKQIGTDFLSIAGTPGAFNTARVSGNQPATVLDRWRKPGDLASMVRYTTSTGFVNQGDFILRDASYVRVKNVSLSYQINKLVYRKLHLKDCRIYLNGQNLLTFTKYKGLDPETQSVTTLPPLRIITLGAQITL